MDTGAVVIPPYVGRPLRLAPFRGVRLSPRRIGDPASGRLFARPYRAVAARLTQWQERGQLRRDDEPAVYLHEYTAGGLTVRGLVGALDISHRASGPEDRAVLEWVSEGTFPDGRPVRYPGVSVLDAQDGDLVRRFRTYYDSAPFLRAASGGTGTS